MKQIFSRVGFQGKVSGLANSGEGEPMKEVCCREKINGDANSVLLEDRAPAKVNNLIFDCFVVAEWAPTVEN